MARNSSNDTMKEHAIREPNPPHWLPFTFEKIEGQYLLVNEVGQWIWLDPPTFQRFVKNAIQPTEAIYESLASSNFYNTPSSLQKVTWLYRRKHKPIHKGTSLFILVPTLRCNHTCLYCQASRKSVHATGYDMSAEMAEAAVQFILSAPAPKITVEFQGGESLLHFSRVQQIIELIYAKNQASEHPKSIHFSLVSNLHACDETIIEFLLAHNVQICSSIDGPAQVHNHNRPSNHENSYARTKAQFNQIMQRIQAMPDSINKAYPGLLSTISHYSLNYPKEIVDTYVELGVSQIALRWLNPFGYSVKQHSQIGYTAAGFLTFYKEAMDHILAWNKKGFFLTESLASLFLGQILYQNPQQYMDLRSPCGAAIGQMVIDYDGSVYTCDEARMLAQMGDESFCLGRLPELTYTQAIENPVTESVCVASVLEASPGCDRCVFRSYCGVCPVYNYAQQQDILARLPSNERCTLQKGIMRYLFCKLRDDPESKQLFETWITSPRYSQTFFSD